jgi:hypothetical protein
MKYFVNSFCLSYAFPHGLLFWLSVDASNTEIVVAINIKYYRIQRHVITAL